jgi:hypothetical protein
MKARDRSNLRFYVLLWLAAIGTRKVTPKPDDIAKLDLKAIDDGHVELAVDEVWKLYEALGASDQVAKGPDLRKATVDELSVRIKAIYEPK